MTISIDDPKKINHLANKKLEIERNDNSINLPPVTSDEFLPPISRWMSLSGIFLAVTIAGAVTVAYFTKYNVTVKANAMVRPVGELRLVQPEVEGTIKSIDVKENQTVNRGDIIARIDDTQLPIKKSQLQGNIQQAELQLVQIDAQIQALKTQMVAEDTSITKAVSAAEADLARNQREYQDKKTTTQTELLAAEATFQKEQVELQKAKADLEFAEREAARYQMLVQAGAIPQREFEQKQLAVQQQKSAVASVEKVVKIALTRWKAAEAALNPSNAIVKIAQEKIAQEKARDDATLATLNKEKQALIQRRVEMETQLRQYQKELLQTDSQLQKSVVRATNDGVILQLNLRNPGQVVRPSESIAQIAPHNAPLIIKAKVPTGEISKVAIGQKVQLRVDACPYPDYGTLQGVVSAVSPDTISTQGTNSATYFEASIQPQTLALVNGARQCRIQPGMEAKADIISKEDTVLRFVLRKARLLTDL